VRGRLCVVTGATRGIGRATAIRLASLGADVVIVGRDERRLDAVRTDVQRTTNNNRVFPVRSDFASLASVREAAKTITDRWPAVHVLINNAGVNSAHRARSADGYELTFAVNHLAPFLLTALLLPTLRLTRGSRSRVINLTSVFAHMGRVEIDDLMFERRRYNATTAYTQSKLANIMFTLELAERLEGSGITVNCVSPALVATDLMREHWWFASSWLHPVWKKLLPTPEDAAERIVRVATADALAGVTGQCFGRSLRPIAVPRRAQDAETRAALWDMSVELTNSPDVPTSMRGQT